MARPKSLAKMSIETLLELRDSITTTLSNRAADLRKQLTSLTGTDVGNGVRRGRPAGRKSSLKGRKVAAKYRSKKDRKLTWAGRGATPRWMRDEMKRGKLKSGRSGKKVKSRKQAIAIGLSEARKSGAKIPKKKRRKK